MSNRRRTRKRGTRGERLELALSLRERCRLLDDLLHAAEAGDDVRLRLAAGPLLFDSDSNAWALESLSKIVVGDLDPAKLRQLHEQLRAQAHATGDTE